MADLAADEKITEMLTDLAPREVSGSALPEIGESNPESRDERLSA
jgi:hypothetical protein